MEGKVGEAKGQNNRKERKEKGKVILFTSSLPKCKMDKVRPKPRA